jgi:hypothetical protein
MMPGFSAAPAERLVLIDRLLRSVENTGNPFLRSPDEMRALGFTGTPYRFTG